MMDGYPETVGYDQMAEVCRVLKLPSKCVAQLTLDIDRGLSVFVYLTDAAGNRIRHAGQYVTTTLEIPIEGRMRTGAG